MDDNEVKAASIAKMLEGRVVPDEKRVQICIKGAVLGFPATLEAVRVGYPFGVSYYLETKVVDDPHSSSDQNALRMTIIPRAVRGFLSPILRMFLMEPKGQDLGMPKLDAAFVSSFNEPRIAERLVRYPGIQENLLELAKVSPFSELLVRTDAGLYLAQRKSFRDLDLDVCKVTFKLLGGIGKIISDSF